MTEDLAQNLLLQVCTVSVSQVVMVLLLYLTALIIERIYPFYSASSFIVPKPTVIESVLGYAIVLHK